MSRNFAKKPNEILDLVRESGAMKVKVAIVDLDGVLRGKYIHRDKFLSAVDGGFGFCSVVFGWDSGDVCYEQVDYTGWHTGYPDVLARIDLSTYRTVPWDHNVPFFLADFHNEPGKPMTLCPRQLLQRVIEHGKGLGFEASAAFEFEWFNFHETPKNLAENGHNPKALESLSPGMFGYSLLRCALNNGFINGLMDELLAFDIPIEGLHTETGPGVYEAAIVRADPLTAADRATLFKTSVKEIGLRHGVMPTFMAKWNAKLPGCSGHLHQSLWRGDESVFHDGQDAHRMSKTFKHYVAGQMHLLPEFLLLYAPTVNSFKRLVEGYWAPTRVTWGVDNRTTALRVIPGSEKSTRLETRVPGSDINPYLAMAGALASGLYGIEKGLELTQAPVVGNGYAVKDATRLPANLHEAALAFGRSEVARELFGNEFVDHYVKTRLWEWEQYQSAVTNWEIERYFEII